MFLRGSTSNPVLKQFIQRLLDEEDAAITRTMSFMSYNPSIGRVLEKGGVKKFQKIALDIAKDLRRVKNKKDFDNLHAKYAKKLISTIRTSKKTKMSYGQAQKPINVFLKLYVDWSHKPDNLIREKLLPYLHVPLDSIIMKTIKSEYPDWYKKEIAPCIKSKTQVFSLSKVNKQLYYKWQNFFRLRYPKKPLIFDIAWELNR